MTYIEAAMIRQFDGCETDARRINGNTAIRLTYV